MRWRVRRCWNTNQKSMSPPTPSSPSPASVSMTTSSVASQKCFACRVRWQRRDAKRLQKALKLILRELKKMAVRPPLATELQRAKDYAIGQMRLGLESSSNQMMWLGEHLLAYGYIHTPDEIERTLLAVTGDSIQAVADHLFCQPQLKTAIITPSEDENMWRDLLTA